MRVTQWSSKDNDCDDVEWKTTETAQTFWMTLTLSRPSLSALTDDKHTLIEIYLIFVKRQEWGERSTWDDFEMKQKNQTPGTRWNQWNNKGEQCQRHPSLAFHTVVVFISISKLNFICREWKRGWFMVEYRRFGRPAAGFWNHAVVLSRTNLKCKLEARAAKLHFIFWEGLTEPLQSPALPLFLRHQSMSSVPGVRRGFRIIKLGAPISLLSPTATFATNLHKGVQSVRDLITHFLRWEVSTQPKI